MRKALEAAYGAAQVLAGVRVRDQRVVFDSYSDAAQILGRRAIHDGRRFPAA
jgi:hypothetical protein